MGMIPGGLEKWAENADSTPPTFGGSVFNSAKEAFTAVPALVVGRAQENKIPVSPRLQSWKDTYDRIQTENQREQELTSSGQMALRKAASFIPNIIGGALDPLSAAFGVAGGAVASPIISRVASGVIEKAAMRKAFVAELGTKAAEEAIPRTLPVAAKEAAVAGAHTGAVMAGYSVPHAYFGTENASEMATEIGANGAMGVGFGVIGYGMGVLWRNVFPREGKIPVAGTPEVPKHLSDLNAAYESGKVPKAEYELMRDYLENPNDPSLPKRFSETMLQRGHEVNSSTYQAYFGMLTDADMQNLKNIFPLELAEHPLAKDKSALSEFTLHNRLDEMRQNPGLIDGLQGFVDHTDHRLERRRSIYRDVESRLNEIFEKSVNENLEFSQKELLRYMEKVGFEESHINNIPVSLPDNMRKYVKIRNRIEELKQKSSNKQTERRIRELENSLPKILTPKEELIYIKEKLSIDKAFPRTQEMTKIYNRLSELAEVWPQAKMLKDHLDISHEIIDKQEAFRDLAQAFIDTLNSNIDRFSDPVRVNNYLRERIGRNIN